MRNDMEKCVCRYHTFVFKERFIYLATKPGFNFVRERERESVSERARGTSSHLRSAVELWGFFLCFCTSVNGAVAQSQLLRWEFPFENVGKTSLKKGKQMSDE